jgi:hypothetical protein
VSDRITIVSSTDNQAAVDEAAIAIEGDKLIPAEEQGYESPIATAEVGSHGSVASSTDSQEEVERVATEANEEKADRAETEGRTKRQLRRTVARLTEEVSKWRKEFGPRSQPAAEQPSEQSANGEARQGPAPEELQRQHQWEAAQLEARVALPYKLQMGQQRYTDFNESIDAVSEDHPLPTWTIEAMKLMPNTADVMYWLSKHSDHMDELLRLDRAGQGPQAMRLLDQISGGLAIGELHTAPRGPQRSGYRAPPPIEHVRGGSAVTHRALDDPNVSYAEYKRRRDAGEGR